jgi:hypothetical protein
MCGDAAARHEPQVILHPGGRADRGSCQWGPGSVGPVKDAKGLFMSIKLTDTQLMMLSFAAQRTDRYLVAAPNMKVAAAQKRSLAN